MMDEAGRVAGGTVGSQLGVVDLAAPGGRRMDPEAVLAAFDEAWDGGSSAVLVEMSDLERADRNGLPPTGPERAAGLAAPLAEADELLGELLERVDLDRDRVLVVSPAAPGNFGRLTDVRHGRPRHRARPRPQRDDPPGRLRHPPRRRRDRARLARPRPARQHELDGHHLVRRFAVRHRGRRPPGRRRRDRPLPRPHGRAGQRRLHRAPGARLRPGRPGPVPALPPPEAGSWDGAALVILAIPPVAFLSGLWRYDRLGLVPYVRGRLRRRGRGRRAGPADPAVPRLPPGAHAGGGELVPAARRRRAREPPAAQHPVRVLTHRRRPVPGLRQPGLRHPRRQRHRGGHRGAEPAASRRGRSTPPSATRRREPTSVGRPAC